MFFSDGRDDSDSGVSSDGQAQTRTEVYSSSSHGAESTQLQLIPLQNEFASHVSSISHFPSDVDHHYTRVAAPFPMQMGESQ